MKRKPRERLLIGREKKNTKSISAEKCVNGKASQVRLGQEQRSA